MFLIKQKNILNYQTVAFDNINDQKLETKNFVLHDYQILLCKKNFQQDFIINDWKFFDKYNNGFFMIFILMSIFKYILTHF